MQVRSLKQGNMRTQRCGHRGWLTLFLVTFTVASYGQTAPSAKPRANPPKDPCVLTKKLSYDEGYSVGLAEASDKAYKSGLSDGQKSGIALGELLFSANVGTASKQTIRLSVEDIDGSTSYQFAAADVIRSFFSDWLEVRSDGGLVLYITGTKSMDLGYGTNVQSISVEVSIPAIQQLVAGEDQRTLTGILTLSNAGQVLKGYSQEQKNTAIRELIYKVLADYKQKWDKAGTSKSSAGN